MKLSTSKRKESEIKYQSRNNSTRKKTIENVPRVQIFLDAHLKKAINQLKIQNSQKKIRKQNETECMQSSRKFKIVNSQMMQSIDPTLISNNIVIDYIRQVYQKYNIPDPLQEDFDFLKMESYQTYRTQKKNRKVSINQKKIIQLKNKFTKQISNFEETAKKIQIENSSYQNFQNSDTNVFDFQNDTTLQESKENSPVKQTDQTSKKVVFLKKINRNQESISTSDRKFPLQNFRKRKFQINNIILNVDPKKRTSSIKDQKINELFRYCFMCEKYLLHLNIQCHEIECQQLQKAYNFSFFQIWKILQNKIQKLKKEVLQGKLLTLQKQNINEMKKSIKQWLQNLDYEQKNQQNRQKKYLQAYTSIQQNLLNPYNQIHKLHWFVKLRQNIKKLLQF